MAKKNSRRSSPARPATSTATSTAAVAPLKPVDVLPHFLTVLASSSDMTPPVAAIKTLVEVVATSPATTYNELHTVLSAAVAKLQHGHKYAIAASAGCTLFNRFAIKAFAKDHNFDRTKQLLVARGNDFVASVDSFRDKIAAVGNPFIQDDAVILIHSYSRVVMRLLQRAAADNKRFTVYVTESRPTDSGVRAVESLRSRGIPAHLIMDSAVAYILGKVDLVLVGAEGVVETGGILNHIGTYQVAMCAREKKVPVYVAVESHKFVRAFPLSQYDLGVEAHVGILHAAPAQEGVSADDALAATAPHSPREDMDGARERIRGGIVDEMVASNPSLDYTPPQYITLLVTDKGVLAPSAVSDELIKVFL
ncbi:putative translation initiation factor eIF-2B subunit alpha [Blastocladiella britannica]|nr:putative translation initiation factor eIF-2B subunit alpha [Blastocladiella britannica]